MIKGHEKCAQSAPALIWPLITCTAHDQSLAYGLATCRAYAETVAVPVLPVT